MEVENNQEVEKVISRYSKPVQDKLRYLRKLILKAASELGELDGFEETLKWGEPSYIAKKGSTIRIDWKEKNPTQYAMYFKCTSKLVGTFKEVYGNKFKYENNRAILFDMEDSVPEKELKHCIAMALQYHRVKHLPLLGAIPSK